MAATAHRVVRASRVAARKPALTARVHTGVSLTGTAATRATRRASSLASRACGANFVASSTTTPVQARSRPAVGQRVTASTTAGGSDSGTSGARAKGRNTGGTIADLFTSLGADKPDMDPRFAALKESIRPPPDVLRDAWARLQESIHSRRRALVGKAPEEVVPVVDFADMASSGNGQVPEEVRGRGRWRDLQS